MNPQFLGRTNEIFAPVWYRLTESDSASLQDAENLASHAVITGAVLDIGANPAKWGGMLRGCKSPIMITGGEFLQSAQSEEQASDFIQAHLLEILCSIGRTTLDFYFLNLPRTLEEFQFQAAIETLEIAKQEGSVRFSGFHCNGEPYAALGHWQFNDAFEVALIPRNPADQTAYSVLGGLAKERRVGIIASRPFGSNAVPSLASDESEETPKAILLSAMVLDHSCLIPVSKAGQIDWVEQAISTQSNSKSMSQEEIESAYQESF